MKKRVLSFVMAMLMVFSLMPVSVFATEAEPPAACAVEGCIVLGEHTEHMYAQEDDGLNQQSLDEVEEEPSDVVEEEISDVVEEEISDVIEEEPSDVVEEEPSDVVEEEPSDVVEEEPSDVVEEESSDVVEEEISDVVEEEISDVVEEEPSDVVEEKVCFENCILAEGHEGDCYVCEEGCVLSGEAEHEENGWECYVWIPCALTEGCELADGHEGDCTGASVFAEATITVSGSSYRNKYIVINDGTSDALYYINSSGTVVNTDGSAVTFDEGTYTIYYAYNSQGNGWGGGSTSCYMGTVTVSGTSASVTATLRSASYGNKPNDNSYTAVQYRYATSVYYNKSSFDHIDVRVAGSYVINIGGTPYTATVSNPYAVIKLNGEVYKTSNWSGTTSYEWRQTGLSLPKSSTITLELTLDLTYTNSDGDRVTMEDVTVVYDNVNNVHEFIEAVAICDMVQGLDFTVDVQDIQESIEYYTVTYQWRVYNLDGSISSDLPASLGSHGLPASESGLQEDSEYVYNTGYVEGTSYYDYDNGLLYTFHGWDTYSHSDVWNVDPSVTGYTALDDGDADASNNKTVPITADTWINGYWTVSELTPSDAYLRVKKVVEVADGGDQTYVENYLANIGKMFISVDPGIDMDGDDAALVDVDYPAAIEPDGYRIDVYQYDTPFVFTEKQADVPGYTRSVVVSVSENSNLTGGGTSDTASITISPEFDPAQAPYDLGTVTYTNTYTKNTGEAVSALPELTLWKSETGVASALSGAEFTLYSDADCKNVVGTYTTAEDGSLIINFADIENVAAGTYYLKETKAPAGYILSDAVYEVILTAGDPVEELRQNVATGAWEYVTVTYYTLFVNTEGTTAAFHSSASQTLETSTAQYSLNVYNDPIVADLNLSKIAKVVKTDSTGTSEVDMPADDKANLSASVIIRGPITRDAQNNITALGATYELTLTSPNWTATLPDLRVGEYLIHESFASVHNYTWSDVDYGGLTKLDYNGMSYVLINVTDSTTINMVLTNTYEEWTAADFYINKINASGDNLAGAEFTLYTDEACKNVASGEFTTVATTDEYGYAHFSGYQEAATYYLKETKAPVGYYLDGTVYKVEIKAVTNETTGKVTYEPKISIKDENDAWVEASFDNSTDLLTVVNESILGQLTVQKNIVVENGTESIPAGLTEIKVNVSGPNYETNIELNEGNDWKVTLNDLPLGAYVITEHDASVPGYKLDVAYSAREITLAESKPGETIDVADEIEVSESATITNTYTRVEEVFETPTFLKVKKVDENGKALAGAEFTLTRDDDVAVSFTTDANGVVTFDMLSGTFDENGKPVDRTYTLTETKAPEGYITSGDKWIVTVSENDGVLSIGVLNENGTAFDRFWEWVISSVTGMSTFTNEGNVLTITNTKVLGELTVSKAQANLGDGTYAAEEVTINIAGPNGYSKQIVLDGTVDTVENKAWSATLTGLELGEYSITEAALDMDGTGYTYHVTMEDTDGSVIAGTDVDGEVLLDISEHTDYVVGAAVEITNTYEKVTGDAVHVYPDFKVYKTDDQRNPLAGATFQLAGAELPQNLVLTADANGVITFEDLKPGTYTLTELSAPAGYAMDNSIYQVVVSVKDGYPEERLVDGEHIMYYEYAIAVTKSGEAVSTPNNTLTVMNHKVSGELTITKSFGADTATKPAAVYVNVISPDGKTTEYILNDVNNWTVHLTGLALGNYVVQEKDASIPGYTLTTTMTDSDGSVTYGNSTDGRVTLAVGDLEAGFTTAVVSASVAITNTYVKNTVNEAEILPDLTVFKLRTGTTNVMLDGAVFTLTDASGNVKTGTTANGGKLVFEDLAPGTYTLVETKAPDGYAVIENTYSFEVVKVSETGEILQANGTWLNTYTYDIKEITDTNETVEVRFVDENNTLAVFNEKSTGSLTIKKEFGVWTTVDGKQVNSSDITADTFEGEIWISVTGPEGFETTKVELNKDNNWTVVLNDIPVGEYTLTEDLTEAAQEDHNLYVVTNPNMNSNGEVVVHLTSSDENGYATFNNTYSKHIPASLDVKKTGENGKLLAGAVFGIYSDASCSDASLVATRTTREDGIATFPSFTTAPATWYLKEISAPANYNKIETVWKIEVTRAENSEVTVLTVDDSDNAEWMQTNENAGVLSLTVENTRSLGDLVINKTVNYVDENGKDVDRTNLPAEYKPDSYTFKVTILDDNNGYWYGYNAKEVSVPAKGSFTIEDVPYGYTYSVQEVTTGAVFTSVVSNSSGKIGAENVVNATNTYTIITETPGLNIVKHDSETSQVIEGAEFTLYSDAACQNEIAKGVTDADGKLNLPLTEIGIFYLKETKAAEGYHENNAVYTITTKYIYENDVESKTVKQIIVVDSTKWTDSATMKLTNPNANAADYEFHVLNTAIKPVIISAEKVWDDDNYYARPHEIHVFLYMDDKSTLDEVWRIYDSTPEDASVEPVVLNEANNWRYVWNGGIEAGLTDEYNWKVVEAVNDSMVNVHKYISNAEDANKDNHWIITNTRTPNAIELTVTKEWIDNNDTSYKPASIEVQLMRDGEAYGSVVVLNEDNGWSHTWNAEGAVQDLNINDAHEWSVVEIVPDGYKATYSEDGWTITNERIIRDISVEVNKEWIHGSNPEADHPADIEAQLVRKETVEINGTAAVEEKVVATAKLNAENNWAYIWTEYTEDGVVKKLTDFYEWEVREVPVADYKETSHTQADDKDANVTVAITNTFDKGKITVTKTVEMEYFDEAGNRVPLTECPDYGTYCPKHGDCVKQEEGRAYEFVLTYTLNGETETVEFSLKNGESKDLYVPVGAEYTVTEVITDETFWNPEYSSNSTGKIDKYDQVTDIAVNNLYVFHDTALTEVLEELEDGLFIGSKVDSKTGEVLSGAKFGLYADRSCDTLLGEYSATGGELEIHFTEEGTYYLKELEAPENYKLSDKVYEIVVEAEYSVYELEGEKIVVKVLRASSDDLKAVATNNGEIYQIPNEEYGKINVSVSKVWLNPKDFDKQPTSVAVVLYRDGEAYATVTLSKDNNWSYKWTDLYENYKWTVDEPNVPKDYTKRVTHIGNAWVITNAHKDVPLTGDDSNILLWAGATGVAVVGLGASLVMLLKKRKEEDEQA